MNKKVKQYVSILLSMFLSMNLISPNIIQISAEEEPEIVQDNGESDSFGDDSNNTDNETNDEAEEQNSSTEIGQNVSGDEVSDDLNEEDSQEQNNEDTQDNSSGELSLPEESKDDLDNNSSDDTDQINDVQVTDEESTNNSSIENDNSLNLLDVDVDEANESDNPSVDPLELFDENTGIKVTFAKESIGEGVEISDIKLDAAILESYEIAIKDIDEEDNVSYYEISLKNGDNPFQLLDEQKATVYIPVEEKTENKVNVYRGDTNDENEFQWTNLGEANLIEEDEEESIKYYLSFETDHFTPFGLVEDVPEQVDENLTFADEATGITAEILASNIKKEDTNDIKLDVVKIEGELADKYSSDLSVGSEDKVQIWDISLVDENDMPIELTEDASATVTIPLTEQTSNTIYIYRGDTVEEGSLEWKNLGATVTEDGSAISFSTNHFTPFAQVEDVPVTYTDFVVTVEMDEAVKNHIGTSTSSYYNAIYVLYRRFKNSGVEYSSVGSKTLNNSNGYTATWENQPIIDPNTGLEYEYTIRRTRLPDFLKSFPYSTNRVGTSYSDALYYEFDNYKFVDEWTREKVTDVTTKISWDDDDNATGVRPTGTIRLAFSYGLGSQTNQEKIYKDVSPNEDGNYPDVIWENIPYYILDQNGKEVRAYYRIDAVGIENYSGSSSSPSTQNLPITLKLDAYVITATMKYADRYTSTKIYKDGSVPGWEWIDNLTAHIVDEGGQIVDSYSFEMPEDVETGYDTYTHKFYYFKNPNAKNYKVVWETDYIDSKQYNTSTSISNSNNSGKTETLTVDLAVHNYGQFNVTWNDNNNALGIRPNVIDLKLQLYANGTPIEIPTGLKSGTTYISGAYGLPQYDENGDEIIYTFELLNIPNYYEATFSYDVTSTTQNNRTKTHGKDTITLAIKDPQEISLNIEFEGDVGSEVERQVRPSSTTVQLLYSVDGKNWQPFWGNNVYVINDSSTSRNLTITNLPSCDENGNPIQFKFTQLDELGAYQTVEDAPKKNEENNTITQTIHNTYMDNWNYTVDLYWNNTGIEKYEKSYVGTNYYDSFTTEYVLAISTQKNYKAETLFIEIPYELFDARSGNKGVIPTNFSIGDEKNPSSAYWLTYKIDDKGTPDTSDDVVIFYNYRDISTGDNIKITVGYGNASKKYYFRDINDFAQPGALTATSRGQYDGQLIPEKQTTRAITYKVDTGAVLKKYREEEIKQLGKRIYYWNSIYGNQPEDFDMSKYHYFSYLIVYDADGNQPFTLTFTEKPSDNGKVVAVSDLGEYYAGYLDTRSKGTPQVFIENDDGTYSWSINHTGYKIYNSYGRYQRVIVAYPIKDNENELEEITYSNDIKIDLRTNDEHKDDKVEDVDFNDLGTLEDEIEVSWINYEYDYDGEIYNAYKNMNDFAAAGLTRLDNGVNPSVSVGGIYATVNGYKLGDYQFDLIDDAVYADVYVNDGTRDNIVKTIRLDENDYYFSGTPYILVQHSAIDRSNGQTDTTNYTKKSIKLWGRKGNSPNDEWELIQEFTLSSNSQTLRVSNSIDESGYTALKVEMPDDLRDYYKVQMYNYSVTVKESSDKFKQWTALYGENNTKTVITNFAALGLYTQNEDGEKKLWSTNNHYNSNRVGLRVDDMKEYGEHIHRMSDSSTLDRVKYGNNMLKWISTTADPSSETISMKVDLVEYETINAKDLDLQIYQNMSASEGVFYDLLPYGYHYDSSKPVVVEAGYNTGTEKIQVSNTLYSGSPYYFSGTNARNYASVKEIETTDDYLGTGRQLVKISVVSTVPAGNNIFNAPSYFNNQSGSYYSTGFKVNFYAIASYEDVTSGQSVYNVSTYMRGSEENPEKILGTAYNEDGITSKSTYRDKDYYVDGDVNGTPYFYDVNKKNNEIGEGTNLYAKAQTTASFLPTTSNGLYKRVRGNGTKYVIDDITDINADYSYRITLTTNKAGRTSDLIIYDILEEAENTGGNTGETKWKGYFTGVDVRNARSLGIYPVVYYSTKNLSYNSWEQTSHTIEEDTESGWIEASQYTGALSDVTAVAFDLRYADKEQTQKVTLNEETTLYVVINMKAPSSLQDAEYTYNRPSFHSTFTADGFAEPTTSHNIVERTSLLLVDLKDIEFTKVLESETGDNKPYPSMEFSLYQLNCTDESHDETSKHINPTASNNTCWSYVQATNSNADGFVSFRNLNSGTYAVVETGTGRAGYEVTKERYWVYEVDARKGTVSAPVGYSTSSNYPAVQMISSEDNDGNSSYTLVNPKVRTELKVNKSWSHEDKNIMPSTLTFFVQRKLTGQSDTEFVDYYVDGELLKKTVEASLTNPICKFENLPQYNDEGVKYVYRAQEEAVPGYSNRYNSSVTNSTINSQTTKTVTTTAVTNTRKPVLTVTKKVETRDGAKQTQEEFEFTVSLSKSDVNYEYPNDPKTSDLVFIQIYNNSVAEENKVGDPFSVSEIVDGKFSFKLKKDQIAFIYNLPINFDYTISEQPGEYVTTGTITSGRLYENRRYNSVFTNTFRQAVVPLNVKKDITHHAPVSKEVIDQVQFNFKLEPITENAPMPKNENGEIISVFSTNTIDTTTILSNLVFTSSGTYEYYITELEETYKEGSSLSNVFEEDIKIYKLVVNVTQSNNYRLSASYSLSYTEDEDKEGVFTNTTSKYVQFTNTYNPEPIVFKIPVSKEIADIDKAYVPEEGPTFHFELSAVDNEPLPDEDGRKVQIKVDKKDENNEYKSENHEFGEIEVTEAGTYRYIIQETDKPDETNSWTYDISEHEITVVIEDVNGRLRITKYYVDDTKYDGIQTLTVTNIHDVPNVVINIPVNKEIKKSQNVDWEYDDEEFVFELTAVDEDFKTENSQTPLPYGVDKEKTSATIKIVGDSESIFEGIIFETAGTYYYTIKEISGENKGYTYSSDEYRITVVVTSEQDDSSDHSHDKIHVATPKIVKVSNGSETPVSEIVFENKYEPESITIELPVKKTVNNLISPTERNKETFNFELSSAQNDELTNSTLDDSNNKLSVTEDETKSLNITLSKPGTYSYTLKEAQNVPTGYLRDTTEYSINVIVEDINGVLTPTLEVFKNDGTLINNASEFKSDDLIFENQYKPTPTKQIIKVNKLMSEESKVRPTKKIFTFYLEPEDENTPMPSTNIVEITDAGEGLFGEITYENPGIYEYSLIEINEGETGYQYDETEYSLKVEVTETDGTLNSTLLIDEDAQKEVNFTNTYIPKNTTVKIPVSKRMTEDSEPRPTEQTFTFVLIAIDDSQTMPENRDEITTDIVGEGNGEFAELTFNEAGIYRYTVGEVNNGIIGYTYDESMYDVEVDVVDIDGKLEAKTIITSAGKNVESIEFVNSYKPTPAKYAIKLDKKITGHPVKFDKTFDFVLTDLATNDVYTASVDGEGTTSFDEITYTSAGKYRYQVKEVVGNELGYTYSKDVYNVIVDVVDTNGVLNAEMTVENATANIIEFENIYKPSTTKQSITINKLFSKDSNERPSSKEFTFKLEAITENAPMPDQSEVKILDSDSEMTEKGERVGTGIIGEIIFEKAGTYEYKLTEVAGGDNGYTYDTYEYKVIVEVTDHDGLLKSVLKIDSESKSEADFVNTYIPSQATAKISVTKKFTNNSDIRPIEEPFTFVLTTTDGISTMKNQLGSESIEINGEGVGEFSELTFTKAGEYHYQVKEEKGNASGYTYSDITYDVVMTVTDKDGELSVSMSLENTTESEIVFENSYKVSPVTYQLSATKILNNKSLENGQFTFELKDENGMLLQRKKNDTNGMITFDAIEYDEAGSYTYTISEMNDKADRVTYDDTVYKVIVTVIDKDSQLVATANYDTNQLKFINTYTPSDNNPNNSNVDNPSNDNTTPSNSISTPTDSVIRSIIPDTSDGGLVKLIAVFIASISVLIACAFVLRKNRRK